MKTLTVLIHVFTFAKGFTLVHTNAIYHQETAEQRECHWFGLFLQVTYNNVPNRKPTQPEASVLQAVLFALHLSLAG